MQNLDATNFVEIRDATGTGNLVKLLAGDPPFVFRLSADATAPYAIADTGTCNVRFLLFPL